jgi:hypothetical protein
VKAVGFRLPLNFSTTKGAIPALSTKTLRYRVPFKFRIVYLNLYAFVGQAYNLQTYIYVGTWGNEDDRNILANVEGASGFFAGDDTSLIMYEIYGTFDAGSYITVKYVNNSSTDALTGYCFIIVEEVEK